MKKKRMRLYLKKNKTVYILLIYLLKIFVYFYLLPKNIILILIFYLKFLKVYI